MCVPDERKHVYHGYKSSLPKCSSQHTAAYIYSLDDAMLSELICSYRIPSSANSNDKI